MEHTCTKGEYSIMAQLSNFLICSKLNSIKPHFHLHVCNWVVGSLIALTLKNPHCFHTTLDDIIDDAFTPLTNMHNYIDMKFGGSAYGMSSYKVTWCDKRGSLAQVIVTSTRFHTFTAGLHIHRNKCINEGLPKYYIGAQLHITTSIVSRNCTDLLIMEHFPFSRIICY